jgi:hypothetical protein
MGIVNDVKTQEAARHAYEALQRGQYVLVYKFIEAQKNALVTGPMVGVGEQIQAIESQGWQLTNMTAGEGKALSGERIAIVAVFRRTR